MFGLVTLWDMATSKKWAVTRDIGDGLRVEVWALPRWDGRLKLWCGPQQRLTVVCTSHQTGIDRAVLIWWTHPQLLCWLIRWDSSCSAKIMYFSSVRHRGESKGRNLCIRLVRRQIIWYYVYTIPNMHAKIFTAGCVLTSIYKNTLTSLTLNGKRLVVWRSDILTHT